MMAASADCKVAVSFVGDSRRLTSRISNAIRPDVLGALPPPEAEISTAVSPPVALQIGEQYGQVRARTRQKPAQPPPQQRALAADLREVEECAIGTPDGTVAVDHHESIRQPIDEFVQRGLRRFARR
jgi:hypothetical protein